MKERTFYIALFALIAVGVIVTAALVAYTVHEYLNASIITYIGRELW